MSGYQEKSADRNPSDAPVGSRVSAFNARDRQLFEMLSEESLYSGEPDNRLGLVDRYTEDERSEDRIFSRIVWTSIVVIAILLSAYLGSFLGSLIF
jgi:hypothetical protein